MLALIPARGGSKGVPRKNVKPLARRPAISWAIEACLNAREVDRVVVTTEDEEIAQAALSAGAEVPFMRPSELATDDCPQGHACLHALDTLAKSEGRDREAFVLVQATSPLIEPADIDGAIRLFKQHDALAVVGVAPMDIPIESVCEIDRDKHFVSVLRTRYGADFTAGQRQSFGKRYHICGAITVLRPDHMRSDVNYYWGNEQALAYPISEENGVDIDTPLDFEFADFLMRKRLNTIIDGGQ